MDKIAAPQSTDIEQRESVQQVFFSFSKLNDVLPRILMQLYANSQSFETKYFLHSRRVCKQWNEAYALARQNLIEEGKPITKFFDCKIKYRRDKYRVMGQGEPIYRPIPSLVAFLQTSALNLRILNASSCGIRDEELQLIKNLTKLHTLTLNSCELITDRGMEAVMQLSSLRILHLHNCSTLTTDGIQKICSLTQLQSLDFKCCRKASNTTVILNLTNLQKLAIPGEASSPELINGLAHLPSLDSFTCHNMSRESVAHIPLLTNLKVLSLPFATLSSSSSELFSKLTALTTLDLAFAGGELKFDFAFLSSLMQLELLDLSGFRTGINLGCLPPSLKQLLLAGKFESSYQDSELQSITRLTQLEVLDLTFHESLTPKCLPNLAALPNIKTLTLPHQLKGSAEVVLSRVGLTIDYDL